MASSPHEFKQRTRKDVTLPSGLQVTIRKVQLWDSLGLGEIAVPAASGASNGRHATPQADSRAWGNRMIERGTVAPRFTAESGAEDDETCVHVLDLDDADYNALLREIMAHAGLRVEVADDVHSFRDDQQRQDPAGAGADVSQAAERADVSQP